MTGKLIFGIMMCLLVPLCLYANDGMGNFPKNNNIFANRLFREENTKKGTENFVISPISLNMAMSLVSNDAKGKTLQEFASLLQNGPFADKFGKYDRNFSKYSQKDMNVYNRGLLANSKILGVNNYKIANGIWLRGNYERNFFLIAKNYYNADVSSLTQNSAKDINDWINRKTEGKITEMVDKIKPNDRAFIVNAVYFYSEWANSFPKYGTAENVPFYLENGEKTSCTMMNDEREYKVLDYKKGKILIKNFKGYASMYFMLPDEGVKLSDYIRTIDFNEVITNDTEGDRLYRIQIPKFKIEYSADMNSTFRKMGLNEAFGPKADFTGLDRSDNIYISSVIHKATIGVDETGCEASAATVVRMAGKGAPRPAENLFFNRPFAFAIVDELNDIVIFEGCVYKPENM
ncbi:MAG: hypothetical protein KBT47_00650 [Armatimonadetes bacterium]|nr:hypothetical protein [Candidatus Hippobium faecium]